MDLVQVFIYLDANQGVFMTPTSHPVALVKPLLLFVAHHDPFPCGI